MNRSKVGYVSNIDDDTLQNTNYRQVLHTGSNMQLVVMKLNVGEEIGEEIHDTHDQFFRIEQGQAQAILNGEESILNVDDILIVPAGVNHNVINVGEGELKLYTIYAPPEHPAGTIQEVKP